MPYFNQGIGYESNYEVRDLRDLKEQLLEIDHHIGEDLEESIRGKYPEVVDINDQLRAAIDGSKDIEELKDLKDWLLESDSEEDDQKVMRLVLNIQSRKEIEGEYGN